MSSRTNWIATAGMLILFVVGLYLGTTDRNKDAFGTFREEAKAEIALASDIICGALAKSQSGRCGPIAWQGKHRWFGRVELDPSHRPAAYAFVAVVQKLGWSYFGTSGRVFEYRKDDLQIGFYEEGELIAGFTVSTNR